VPKVTFNRDEVELAFAILNELNPDRYIDDEVRALIYKVKSVRNDTFYIRV
jgi:hypothetical protein